MNGVGLLIKEELCEKVVEINIGLSHKFVRFLLLKCLCVLIIFCDTSYVNIHIILIIYAFSNLLSTDFVYSITLFHSLSDGVPS